MLRRFWIWTRRISIASLVLLLILECIAFSSPRMHVIRTTNTRQTAISLSVSWFGLVRVEDPGGEAIPFFKPNGSWGDSALPNSSSRTRFEVPLLLMHDSGVFQTKQGGWLLIDGWGIGYGPIALLALVWPINLTMKWSWATFTFARATLRKRRNIHRQLAFGERCPSCGYDLRATSERCPECGVEFTRRTVIVPVEKAN